jgi:hypothetical protein
MSQRVGELLLTAIRSLPPEEQDEVLVELLGSWPPAPADMLTSGPPADPSSAHLSTLLSDLRPARSIGPPAATGDVNLRVLPVRLPASDYERLRAWSKDHDFSMAVIIRTLVEQFLDRQQKASGQGRG